ncbi:PAS domain-containing protein [Ferrovibrio terrae]|uniref:PAS domain-containing protein n=1 Tax=Ferrovibrio terrae TaxID=2594003 RepID=A0A516GZL7_9PROT|nr:PAS domain-containing protein [Ferrovibrio terrae]QDO96967.1 PAS domain-containing protein [Ferrovibrio terrae]
MTLQHRAYLHPQLPTLEASYGKAPATDVEALMSGDSRHLLAAWKRWRGERLLPHRRDMDLVSIARLMPRLVLLDVFSPQRVIFRLAGTEIESIAGMRLTGRDHILMAQPDQRASRSRLLWGAATQPCGALAFHIVTHPDNGRLHQIETFVLPILPDSAEAPTQLIGLAAGLPVLEVGSHVTRPLEFAGATQHFLDLGGGIPA